MDDLQLREAAAPTAASVATSAGLHEDAAPAAAAAGKQVLLKKPREAAAYAAATAETTTNQASVHADVAQATAAAQRAVAHADAASTAAAANRFLGTHADAASAATAADLQQRGQRAAAEEAECLPWSSFPREPLPGELEYYFQCTCEHSGIPPGGDAVSKTGGLADTVPLGPVGGSVPVLESILFDRDR